MEDIQEGIVHTYLYRKDEEGGIILKIKRMATSETVRVGFTIILRKRSV